MAKITLLSHITRLFEYDMCTRTPQLSNFSDCLLFWAWVQTRSQKFDDRKSRPYDHKTFILANKQQIKTMVISPLDSRKMCIYYQGIPLTGLTIPHFGVCPKLGPGFQRHMYMSLSFFNDRSNNNNNNNNNNILYLKRVYSISFH